MACVKVGVISDTHGMLRPEVMERLAECDCIVHAGDFCREEILERLEELAPVYAVRGNNDWGWREPLPQRLEFEIGGVRFYMVHDRDDLPMLPPKIQVVVFGHSHLYYEDRARGKLWLNPGSCGRPRFRREVTMAVLTIQDGEVSVERVDLEA